MLIPWNKTLDIAVQLDRLYPECDLLSINTEHIFQMIIQAKLCSPNDDILLDVEVRANILNSILWHWMRMRGGDDQNQQRNLAG